MQLAKDLTESAKRTSTSSGSKSKDPAKSPTKKKEKAVAEEIIGEVCRITELSRSCIPPNVQNYIFVSYLNIYNLNMILTIHIDIDIHVSLAVFFTLVTHSSYLQITPLSYISVHSVITHFRLL